jgi:hypothetical protein
MATTSKQILSSKHDAILTLHHHHIEPENLIIKLCNTPNMVLTFKDSNSITWSFMIRKRNRIFLMAKNEYMTRYEEIYSFILR